MKKIIVLIIWILFSYNELLISKPYYLHKRDIGERTHQGSRMPKHSLCIDLTDHVLVVPSQLLGFTLTLVDENGKDYSCMIMDGIVVLPQNLRGEYTIKITNNQETYIGEINL